MLLYRHAEAPRLMTVERTHIFLVRGLEARTLRREALDFAGEGYRLPPVIPGEPAGRGTGTQGRVVC